MGIYPGMTLEKFRTKWGWSYERLGESLNVSRQFAYRLCTNKTKPSLAMAFRIERMTRGKVKASSFIEKP